MKHIHLPPRLYDSIQNYIHRSHQKTFEILTRLLELKPGEKVLEVGCGTGVLARYFAAHEYDYWGIDMDLERIKIAQQRTPEVHFLVGNALTFDYDTLPKFKRCFIHGILHHLDDLQCRRLIDRLLLLHYDVHLVVTEPFCPNRWYTNPLGSLLSYMDEGRFVRNLQGWQYLFGANVDVIKTRSLWPRYPVNLIDVRLTNKHNSTIK